MQSKGAVKLFAILLALVCLYQLSFTFVTSSVERSARSFANGDAVKEKAYIDSVSSLPAYHYSVSLIKSARKMKSILVSI